MRAWLQQKSWVREKNKEKEEQNLKRETRPVTQTGATVLLDGKSLINFSSNDYLGLTKNPKVVKAASVATENFGSGCGSSRLLSGTLDIHEELEADLASWKGSEKSLVFGAGYLANIGIVSALIRRDDVVFSDKLVHASLIDGIILSRAEHVRYKHNDLEHIRELLTRETMKRKKDSRFFIITESVFSMDGDVAPLSALSVIAEEFEAVLIVDEAHAVGVFGPSGAGVINQEDLEDKIYLSTFTLSKALGSYGGVVSCPKEMRELLVNTSRSFIYNTSLPASSVAAASEALSQIKLNPDMGKALLLKAAHFRDSLKSAGLNVLESQSQIVPVVVGESAAALRFSRHLQEEGILVPAIREPTVPQGSSRLRFSICLDHTPEELSATVESVITIARAERVL